MQQNRSMQRAELQTRSQPKRFLADVLQNWQRAICLRRAPILTCSQRGKEKNQQSGQREMAPGRQLQQAQPVQKLCAQSGRFMRNSCSGPM